MNLFGFVLWYVGIGLTMFVGVVGYGLIMILPPVIKYNLGPGDSKTFMLLMEQVSGVDQGTKLKMAVAKLLFWPVTLTDYSEVVSTYKQIREELVTAASMKEKTE